MSDLTKSRFLAIVQSNQFSIPSPSSFSFSRFPSRSSIQSRLVLHFFVCSFSFILFPFFCGLLRGVDVVLMFFVFVLG